MPENISIERGDVVLVPFPNSNLQTTKLRPALAVQSNTIDSELGQTIFAMLSSNLRRVGRKGRVLIVRDSAPGRASGLLSDSVVMTDNLATILNSHVTRVIGKLTNMPEVDEALRHSLQL